MIKTDGNQSKILQLSLHYLVESVPSVLGKL